jgi:hypothetical protein
MRLLVVFFVLAASVALIYADDPSSSQSDDPSTEQYYYQSTDQYYYQSSDQSNDQSTVQSECDVSDPNNIIWETTTIPEFGVFGPIKPTTKKIPVTTTKQMPVTTTTVKVDLTTSNYSCNSNMNNTGAGNCTGGGHGGGQ